MPQTDPTTTIGALWTRHVQTEETLLRAVLTRAGLDLSELTGRPQNSLPTLVRQERFGPARSLTWVVWQGRCLGAWTRTFDGVTVAYQMCDEPCPPGALSWGS